MLLIIVNYGGNKLFQMCKSISSKGSIAKLSQNQGTYFYRDPNPVPIKLEARKCIILLCLCINLRDEVVFLFYLLYTYQ